MELKEIILALKSTTKETGLEISDEVLFDASIRIYNSQNIKSEKKESFEVKATEKQIELLYKLGADFNAETITKREAMDLIKGLVPEKKEKKPYKSYYKK